MMKKFIGILLALFLGISLLPSSSLSDTWIIAWNPTLTSTLTAGERNYRQIIDANTSNYSGDKIRITVPAVGGNFVIDGASIGVSTANDDFDAAPTRITWTDAGGGNGITIPTGTSVTSDEITFDFDKTKRHAIHFYMANREFSRCNATTGFSMWWDADGVDDTLTANVTYAEATPRSYLIDLFEVETASYSPVTYYVDATTGDDSDTGLTEELAWETISKVNTGPHPGYNPGDIIKFKCGEEWRDASLIPPSSGSSGEPITFTSYGEGADPIINGAIDITAAAYKWTASGSGSNEYYCELTGGGDPSISTVGDIVIMDDTLLQEGTIGGLADHEWAYGNNDTLGYNTVYVRDDSDDPDDSGVVIEASQNNQTVFIYNKDYITLDGLTIKGGDDWNILHHTANHLIVDNCLSHLGAHGIRMWGNCTYLTVSDSIFEYNYRSGISFVTGSSYQTITDNISRHNGVSTAAGDNAECGIIGHGDNCTISGNTVHDNCHSVTQGQGHGIYISFASGSSNNSIHNNTCYDNPNGSGIKIANPSGINAYRNLCYDNYEAGIVVTGPDTHGSITCSVYYNICYGNHRGFYQYSIGAVSGFTLNVYNNIFYHNNNTTQDGNISEIRFYDDCGNGTVNIKNNIVFGDNTRYEWEVVAQTGTFNVDYNCTRYGDFYYDGAVRNWAYWQGTAGFDVNGLNTDPLMIDPASDDFRLLMGSTCINAGTDVSLTTDYRGRSIRHAPDIGAHEEQTNVIFMSKLFNSIKEKMKWLKN